MLHLFMKVTVFMRKNTVFRQENTWINESTVASESSFPLPQQHGLVRHALLGHPTHFVQNLAVLRRQEPNQSSVPLTTTWPFELKITDVSQFVCSCNTFRQLPGSRFQSRTVRSPLPLAKIWPSGLRATDQTPPVGPRKTLMQLPVWRAQSRIAWSKLPRSQLLHQHQMSA